VIHGIKGKPREVFERINSFIANQQRIAEYPHLRRAEFIGKAHRHYQKKANENGDKQTCQNPVPADVFLDHSAKDILGRDVREGFALESGMIGRLYAMPPVCSPNAASRRKS
jgi:hypothetical protein